MKYDVVILPTAEREIDRILSWLMSATQRGAAAWLKSLDQVVELLKAAADGYGRAPENDDHELLIQQVIFKTRRGSPYRALFTLRNDTVYILHVRGPGQNTMDGDEIALPE